MKIAIIVFMFVIAVMNAKTVQPTAKPSSTFEYTPSYQCDYPETEPTVEMINGYMVIYRINDTDVCLLVNGVPTWVTIIDENDCDCVDWNAFDPETHLP